MTASPKIRERTSLDTSRPTTQYGSTTMGIAAARSRERAPVLTIGNGVERGRVLIPATGENMLGRSSNCDFRLAFRGVSRQHAVLELSAAGLISLVDSGSTNGTYINDMQIDKAVLSEGDVVRLGPEARLHVTWLDEEEVTLRCEQNEQSTQDDLTRIANRRYFEAALEHLLRRCADTPVPFGLILFDLDHFKLVNDAFGHAAGDLVLFEVARRVDNILREGNRLCRYGGEEFCALMVAGRDEVITVAERVRTEIEQLKLQWRGHGINVTASVGVVTAAHQADFDGHQVVELADQALYKAKALGRNQVVTTTLKPQ